ncbi:cache domain-containing protein [Caenispirillum bisanense]|uniref:HAMP domain-containing protein n=1 Tax=Caenispirillum bisanense TaxID=414052 RepID=A0A286GU84_9PROT|nr:cache domain-containing protein [Caenispirillum bisanense]SOD98544.1 HAMP domain-containing protein [Caenispirillum bisanense]
MEPLSVRAPALASSIIRYSLMSVALVMVILGVGAYRHLGTVNHDTLATATQARGQGLALVLMRALHQTWTDLQAIGSDYSTLPPDELATRLTALTEGERWVAWAGYAGLDGRVRAASGGLLDGADVAGRPWFRQGLEGPFAGNPHEAKLLAPLLPANADGSPVRLLDLAVPVTNDRRQVVGVVGAHVGLAEVAEFVRETAAALDIDAFMITGDGAVVIASSGPAEATIDTASIRAAMAGARRPFVETWPDGAAYMTYVLPKLTYKDLPPFDWSLVVRIPVSALASRSETMLQVMGIAALVASLVAAGLALWYARSVGGPLQSLAESAVAISRGEDVYPAESRRTREAAILSGALASLQRQLRRRAAE